MRRNQVRMEGKANDYGTNQWQIRLEIRCEWSGWLTDEVGREIPGHGGEGGRGRPAGREGDPLGRKKILD